MIFEYPGDLRAAFFAYSRNTINLGLKRLGFVVTDKPTTRHFGHMPDFNLFFRGYDGLALVVIENKPELQSVDKEDWCVYSCCSLTARARLPNPALVVMFATSSKVVLMGLTSMLHFAYALAHGDSRPSIENIKNVFVVTLARCLKRSRYHFFYFATAGVTLTGKQPAAIFDTLKKAIFCFSILRGM